MVEIDRNEILVKPLKSQKDLELTRAYQAMMLRLKGADIVPKKHVLDNKVSEAMRNVEEKNTILKWNWCHQDVTEETQRRLQFKTSKPTS